MGNTDFKIPNQLPLACSAQHGIFNGMQKFSFQAVTGHEECVDALLQHGTRA